MVDFFMWGGFIFCVIWHVISHLLLWADGGRAGSHDTAMFALMANIGLSGVSLCYFGMLAFE